MNTQDFGSLGGSSLAIDFKSDGRVNIEELPSDATVTVYTASGYTALEIDNDANDKIYVSDVGIGHSTSASFDSNINVDASATAFTYTYTSGGSSLDGQTIIGTGSTTLQSGGANLVFDVLDDGVIAGVKTAVGGDVVFTLTPVITGTDVIYRLDMFDVIDDPAGASAIGYLFDIDISIDDGVTSDISGGITVGFDQLGTDTTSTSQGGDTTLVASYGAETLIAGTGTDTFQWELSDGESAGDVVTDYTRGTDIIDIGDLLSTGIADADLDHYIYVDSDGTDTVIRVSSTGDFSDGYDPGSDTVDQMITVEGVDLTEDAGGSALDASELTALLKSLYTGIVDPNGP